MRILVAGAGAIGSAVGACLAEAGHAVALLGRGAAIRRVGAGGLTIDWPGGRATYPQIIAGEAAAPLVAELGGLDLAIVTTKVHDTGEVCRAAREVVQDAGATTLLLQNGVGGDAIAAEVLQGAPLVAGVITWIVSALAPGEYAVRNRRRGIGLAPYAPLGAPGHAAAARLARAFRDAGVICRVYEDARAVRWSKLLLNMLGNAIPAILDLAPPAVYADPRLYALERAAFGEALAVMRAEGIPVVDLPGYPVRLLAALMGRAPERLSRPVMARLIAGGRSGKTPSLLIDVQRGRRRSEVTALNGAVTRAGEQLGLATPVNATVCEVLVRIILGEIPRTALARNPLALLERARANGWNAP